jgi:hypothetical protein
MRRLKLWLPLAAVTAFLTGAAVAAVPQDTVPVTATFTAIGQTVQQRTCQADDGNYLVATDGYVGAVTGNSRLSGAMALYLTSVTNTTTGDGTTQGLMVVRDATSQQIKLQAAVSGVATTGGHALHGLIAGRVHATGSPDGFLTANFSALKPTSSTLIGSLGGAGDTAHPAVIQRLACSTPPPRIPGVMPAK